MIWDRPDFIVGMRRAQVEYDAGLFTPYHRLIPAPPAVHDDLDKEGWYEMVDPIADEDTGKDPEDQPTAPDDVKVPGDTTPERDALPEQLLSENSDDTEEGK